MPVDCSPTLGITEGGQKGNTEWLVKQNYTASGVRGQCAVARGPGHQWHAGTADAGLCQAFQTTELLTSTYDHQLILNFKQCLLGGVGQQDAVLLLHGKD